VVGEAIVKVADLVSMGDLPGWVAAVAGSASLYQGISKRRTERAIEFAETIQSETGLTPEQLRDAVERNEQGAELLAMAWDAATRTVDQRKRRLLARAAKAGILNEKHVAVDELPLLIRSINEIEASHMKLLSVIGGFQQSRANSYRRVVRTWPGVRETFEVLIAGLEREGLIRTERISQFPIVDQRWRLTNHGIAFIEFVNEAEPELLR